MLTLLATLSTALVVPRRAVLSGGAAAAISRPSLTSAAEAGKPVLVLGAGGGTGRACVAALVARGVRCIATTRSGKLDDQMLSSPLASLASADVTQSASLASVIAPGRLSGVIFAASASAKGGDAAAVDRQGVLNAARCCIDAGVPRLVIVSSGAVTQPGSSVYQLLNIVGKGIMAAKIEGEDGVRELYSAPDVAAKGLGYTIVRPGGLTPAFGDDGAWLGRGAAAVELNQGDSKSGRISRADVASLCVEALTSAAAFDTTFECYDAETAKPIESVGFSNLLRSTTPTSSTSGYERRGASWPALFAGLRRDAPPAATGARWGLVPPASAAECDAACQQMLAERRALFEQSRTTNDRQKILDLSRQRAALYNTSFNGASCIPGLPCL